MYVFGCHIQRLQQPFLLDWHKNLYLHSNITTAHESFITPPLCFFTALPHPPSFCKSSASWSELIKQYHPKTVWFHQTWLFHALIQVCKKKKKGNSFIFLNCSSKKNTLQSDFLLCRMNNVKLDAVLLCAYEHNAFVTDRFKAGSSLIEVQTSGPTDSLIIGLMNLEKKRCQSDSTDHDSPQPQRFKPSSRLLLNCVMLFVLLWQCHPTSRCAYTYLLWDAVANDDGMMHHIGSYGCKSECGVKEIQQPLMWNCSLGEKEKNIRENKSENELRMKFLKPRMILIKMQAWKHQGTWILNRKLYFL